MNFQEPEIVDMGKAAELVRITCLQPLREDPSQPEPTHYITAVYAPDGE